jgi:hypothetical protein
MRDFSSTTSRHANADIESVNKNLGLGEGCLSFDRRIEVTDTAGDGEHELARLTGHHESKSPLFFLSNIEQPR